MMTRRSVAKEILVKLMFDVRKNELGRGVMSSQLFSADWTKEKMTFVQCYGKGPEFEV